MCLRHKYGLQCPQLTEHVQDILPTERRVVEIKGDVENLKNRKCLSRIKMFTEIGNICV